MKKAILLITATILLSAILKAQKEKQPPITVQCQLIEVVYNVPGKAILKMKLVTGDTLYAYQKLYKGFRAKKYVLGTKYTIQYKECENGEKYRPCIIKENI